MPLGGLKGTLTGNANSITNPTDATGSVAVVARDLIFGVIGEQLTLTSSGVTDNLGNTYTALNAGTDAGTSTGRAFYSVVTVAGTLTAVHFAATASTDNVAVFAAVINGPFIASPLDANPANITTDITSPYTCPATGTLGQPVEVVMAWGVATGSTVWAATSPNLLAGQIATQAILHTVIGYQLVNSASTISPVFTAGSDPTDCVLGTCSFKADMAGISWGFEAPGVSFAWPTPTKRINRAGMASKAFFAASSSPFPWFESNITQPPSTQGSRVVHKTLSQPVNIDVRFINWQNAGWETQSVQPPQFKRKQPFTEYTWRFDQPLSIITFGWDNQQHLSKKTKPTVDDASVDISSVFVNWLNVGWEIQSPQPNHPRPERAASTLVGDQGNQAPVSFQPYGWEIQPVQPPQFKRKQPFPEYTWRMDISQPITFGWDNQQHLVGLRKRTVDDASVDVPSVFVNWLNVGWEIQAYQPPHFGKNAAVSYLPAPVNVDSQFVSWQNDGWEVVSPLFNRVESYRSAQLPSSTNIDYQFVNWINGGWEPQFGQPPAVSRRAPYEGGVLPSPLNIEAIFQPRLNYGWEIAPYQPQHLSKERNASWLPAAGNVDAAYVDWQNAGWETQSPQPKKLYRQIYPEYTWRFDQPLSIITFGWDNQQHIYKRTKPTVDDASVDVPSVFVNWLNVGWEALLHQLNHPRPERAASTLIGDQGNQSQFVNWQNTGWELQTVQPPQFKRKQPFPEYTWRFDQPPSVITFGWDNQQHISGPRRNTVAGIYGRSQFASVSAQPWGWETQPVQPQQFKRNTVASIYGRSQFASFSAQPWGWSVTAADLRALVHKWVPLPDPIVQPTPRYIEWDLDVKSWQLQAPQHHKIYQEYTWRIDQPPSIITFGWDNQQHLSKKIKPTVDDASVDVPSVFVNWLNVGWETQSVQPQQFKRKQPYPEYTWRFDQPKPITFGWDNQQHLYKRTKPTVDDASVDVPSVFVNWLNVGWEALLHQPNHPRPEKASWLPSPLFIDVPQVTFQSYGWAVQPYQPQHVRVERTGSIQPKEDGIQAQFVNWQNAGWEIQSVQPPQFKREQLFPEYTWKIIPSITPNIWGQEQIQAFWMPHPRPERFGSIAAGDQGNQAQFINWKNAGWEIQAYQPQHHNIERFGSVVVGDTGIEGTKVSFQPYGWELQTVQPPQFKRNQLFPEYTWRIDPLIPPNVWGQDSVQAFWLPRRYWEKVASHLPGPVNIDYKFVDWKNAGWEEMKTLQLMHRGRAVPLITFGQFESVFDVLLPQTTFYPGGWEIQSLQPPMAKRLQLFPEYTWRIGQPPSIITFGWDNQQHLVGLRKRTVDDASVDVPSVFVNWLNAGWETQSVQPPQFKRNQLFPEYTWRFDQPQLITFGWELQSDFTKRPPIQKLGLASSVHIVAVPDAPSWGFDFLALWLPRRYWEKSAAQLPSVMLVEAQKATFQIDGWEVQSPQLPHPRAEKSEALYAGELGIENVQILFKPYGWETPSPQPPRFQKLQNYLWSTGRIDTPLIIPVPLNWGYEQVPNFQPPHFQNHPGWMEAYTWRVTAPPFVITIGLERLLASPGKIRELDSPYKIRILKRGHK